MKSFTTVIREASMQQTMLRGIVNMSRVDKFEQLLSSSRIVVNKGGWKFYGKAFQLVCTFDMYIITNQWIFNQMSQTHKPSLYLVTSIMICLSTHISKYFAGIQLFVARVCKRGVRIRDDIQNAHYYWFMKQYGKSYGGFPRRFQSSPWNGISKSGQDDTRSFYWVVLLVEFCCF